LAILNYSYVYAFSVPGPSVPGLLPTAVEVPHQADLGPRMTHMIYLPLLSSAK